MNDVFQNREVVLFKVGNMAIRGFNTDIDGIWLTFEVKEERIIDQETNSIWDEHGQAVDRLLKGTILKRIQNGHIAFWFAWVAFYPLTEVFE